MAFLNYVKSTYEDDDDDENENELSEDELKITEEEFRKLVGQAEQQTRAFLEKFVKLRKFPFIVKVSESKTARGGGRRRHHYLGWYRHNSIWSGKAKIFINKNLPNIMLEENEDEDNYFHKHEFEHDIIRCVIDTILHELGHAIFNYFTLIVNRDLDSDGYTKEQRLAMKEGMKSSGDEEEYVEWLVDEIKDGDNIQRMWWYPLLHG